MQAEGWDTAGDRFVSRMYLRMYPPRMSKGIDGARKRGYAVVKRQEE